MMFVSHVQPRRRLRGVLAAAFAAAAIMMISAGNAFGAGGTSKVTGQITVPTATVAGHMSVVLLDAAGDPVDAAPTLTVSGTTVTYTFSNEPAGTYVVGFSDSTAADHIASLLYSSTGAVATLSAATPITVGAGATAALNTTAIPSGGTISGQVTDQNSATVLADSQVTACPVPQSFNIDCAEVRPNSAGAFTFVGLAAGNYRLAYEPENSSSDPVLSAEEELGGGSGAVFVSGSGVTYSIAAASLVAVGAGGTASVSFTMPKAATISGSVTVEGTPAQEDLLVSVYDTLGNPVAGATTSAGGAYSVLMLPGSYKIEASAEYQGFGLANVAPSYAGATTFGGATTENVTSGQSLPNVNIDLPAGATISGKVTAAQGGAALGGLQYALVDASGNSALGPLEKFYSLYLGLLGSSEGVELSSYYTAADGTYTILGVPAGTWYLEFLGGLAWNGDSYIPAFYGGTPSVAGAKPITVTAGQSATVNQALLQYSATAPGVPQTASGGLSGLAKDKVALSFKLAAGSGIAADLQSFAVKLPRGFSWDGKTLQQDLSLGAGVPFTYTVTGGQLDVTFGAAERAASLTIKAGGITVTKAIEKAAGGGPKLKPKKVRKGRKVITVKPKPRKDTIATETIGVTVADTAGVVTPLTFVVKKPH